MVNLIVIILTLCSSLALAGPAEDDYATRKAGAVYAVDFDTIGAAGSGADITTTGTGRNITYDGLGVNKASLDTETKRSGTGALRFDVDAPPHAGANIAGQWTGTLPATYKAGDTFYFQYAVRWSYWLINNTYPIDRSWKAAIICFGTCTCAPLGIVHVNYNHTDIMSGYTNCGQRPFTADLTDHFAWHGNGDANYRFQGHDFNCRYSQQATDPCFKFKANIWHTITTQIVLGTWGGNDSTVKIEVWTEGVPLTKKLVHITNMQFNCNNPPGCNGNTEGFNKVELSGVYMSDLLPEQGLPFPSRVWYDEFILSTSPIPAPAVMPADSDMYVRSTGGSSTAGGGAFQ